MVDIRTLTNNWDTSMSIIFFMENRISFVTHGKPNETCNIK